jgi:hypothetical protein
VFRSTTLSTAVGPMSRTTSTWSSKLLVMVSD